MAKHEEFEKELNVQVTMMITEKHIKHNLTGLDWKSLQENDPIIQRVLKWKCCNSDKNAKKDKNADWHTLEEYLLMVVNSYDAKVYGNWQKDFTLLNDMLFINDTPKGSTDMVLLFVHIHLVGMEVTVKTKKKPVVQKILVVTDHFSQFVQAYKVKDKRAITIAKCLYDNYFRHYGFP